MGHIILLCSKYCCIRNSKGVLIFGGLVSLLLGRVTARSVCLFVLIANLAPTVAVAEKEESPDMKEVVVTANRIETPIKKVGGSISVITADDIKEKKQFTVAELLKTLPGVDVVRAGGSGGITSVFLRGANPEHTLVIVDGIEVNNPMSNARTFNFADLTPDNIERIEVMRGPQTTLYGSDALGGVIQIITKKGEGAPTAQAQVEVGSYDTYREAASTQGSVDFLKYSLGFSRLDRSGMSAVDNPAGGTENDKYEDTAGSVRLDAELNDIVGFGLTGRITNSHAGIDDGPGSGDDDPNRRFNSTQYSTRGTTSLNLFDDVLKQVYGISYASTTFSDDDDADEFHPIESLRSEFRGQLLKVDLQNTIQIAEDNALVFGFETEEEKGSSSLKSDGEFGPFESEFLGKSVRTNGMYGQFALEPVEDFDIAIGGRYDDNSRFGTKETWRVSPSYYVEHTGTRFKSSAGTGYKAPSLYQLFSEFGREDLRPERSFGIDAGFEQEFLDKDLVIGATYFRNRFKDLISFDPSSFIFENIAEATTQGFESFVQVEPIDEVTLKLNYTFTEADDDTNNTRLLRRAKHRAVFDLAVRPCEKLQTNLNVLVVGNREDNDFSAFPAERVRLGGYTVVNLAAEYELHKHVNIFAHADNLFDKDYQEVFGFNTPSATFYGGLKFGL